MNDERLAMKGALKDKEQLYNKAKTLAQGLFAKIRTELKSYIEIEELDMDLILELVKEFHAKWTVIRQLVEEIKKLEADLYG